MFGLFKSKSKKEKLNQQYKKLMAEAHQLSKSNRTASDAKIAAAQKVLDQMDALKEE